MDFRFASEDKVNEINTLKHDGLWRLNLNNNNNNLVESTTADNYGSADVDTHVKRYRLSSDGSTTGKMGKTKQTATATTTTTLAAVAVTPTCVAHVEDEGGGEDCDSVGRGIAGAACAEGAAMMSAGDSGTDKLQQNGAAAYVKSALSSLDCDLDLAAYGLAAAVTLSPLSPTDAAVGGISSSRTSLNNSTENLSYASDNYYPEDLILLDDDDAEAEEISLNSDDCVYAYRGDGTDFDLAALDASTGRGGRSVDFGMAGGVGGLIGGDDETEFLEMDFEPDPASELDFADGNMDDTSMDHANLLLMQRDYNHLSGRRSANNMLLPSTVIQRQPYSSPIDDLPPKDVLQQQKQRLSKKFARISLNLDQIKDAIGADDAIEPELDESVDDSALNDTPLALATVEKAQAHSLPNTLYTSFGRCTSEPAENIQQSTPKVTGAKPKRLATLSTSSSVSSKNSSKSRSSLRSAYAPTHGGNSVSFDERCYSCTDFRAVAQPNMDVAPMLVAAAAVVAAGTAMAASASVGAHFDLSGSSNEEACLDCLEKEFLANTIGKALDLSSCLKCRKRGSSISLYARAEQTRCRSGSPGYFDEFDGLFAAPTRKSLGDGWPVVHTVASDGVPASFNQRFISCDNDFGDSSVQQLLKQSFSTEPQLLVARLCTAQLSEEHLVQALDKLHISYNAALVQRYFERDATAATAERQHANLRELLLHASKQQCNPRKIKQLIQLACQQQVNVQFKQDDTRQSCNLVPLKVADVLSVWQRNKDLTVLQQLGKHFQLANILGKIAYVVRQSQPPPAPASSSSASRCALPEFLMIPQYYSSGELTLTRKC